ncbi:FAD-dependent oxidoreductase [Nocardia takedensis]|uniref:FAD-dependent oxidoreductase n=1 Tax=Nocardia takedensis TaxID=259390 RepID=UPI001FDF33F5|nr:FAD-dependent oxidoreductase [Nocardia takedensis]
MRMPPARRNDHHVSRRRILRGAGALTVATAASTLLPRPAAATPTGRRVAIFGAGPGGMSMAHEMAERGFQVEVYERLSRLGGGVRSYVTPGGGTDGRPSLPYTCGGHFFLPGYAALPNLLRRIPTGDGGSMIDRLTVSSHGMTGLGFGVNGTLLGLGVPTSPDRLADFSLDQVLDSVRGLLAPRSATWPTDAPLLASKVAAWVTSGPLRRAGQLEFLDLENGFFRADLLSPTAHTLIRDLCQTTSNDSPTTGLNALTMLTSVVDQNMSMAAGRLGPDNSGPSGLLMDGPETEVWFDPWARHLESLGATFHTRRTVTELAVDNGRITGATVQDENGAQHRVEADWFVLAMPPDRLAPLISPALVAADPELADIGRLHLSAESGFELFFRDHVDTLGGQVTNRDVGDGWLLTLVGMSEIWDLDLRDHGDGRARGMLSVEFNNHPYYDSPGPTYRKPIRALGHDEAFAEIRRQIIEGFPGGDKLFAGDNFLGWRPHPTLNWDAGTGWTVPDLRTASAPGTTRYFPRQARAVPNLFLVGGHTATPFGLDCMESAAYSACVATNALLERAGIDAPVAALPFTGIGPEFAREREQDDALFRAGRPNMFDTIAPARMP